MWPLLFLLRVGVPVFGVFTAFQFLVRVFAVFRFKRVVTMSGMRKTPPTAPYLIPLLFHMLDIMVQGLPSFISKSISDTDTLMEQTPSYDKRANLADFPFTVKASISKSYVVVKDPTHVRKVLHAEQIVPEGRHVQLLDKVVGAPKEALRLYEKSSRSPKKDDDLVYAKVVLPRKHLQGDHLTSIAEKYISNLSRNMASKMFQEQTWTEIEDLWSFIQLEVTRAMVEALFGSALLKMYPRLVNDFVRFESGVDDMAQGSPPFMNSTFMNSNVYNARVRLLKSFNAWLQSCDQESAVAEGQETWDATRGSSFFQASDRAIARITPGYEARASAALGLLQRAVSGVACVTFWSMVEVLRDQRLVQTLTSFVEQCYRPGTGLYGVIELTSNPLIQSLHAEVARLRMSSYVVLHNQGEKFDLDESWTIPQGSFVAIPSRRLAMNIKLWHKARPQAVQVPLERFWAERFLMQDHGSNEIGKRESTGVFSLASVEPLMTAYGGGSHACPGQHLAKAIQIGTLAVFLNEYEIQLSDPDEVEHSIQQQAEKDDAGCKKPQGNVRMRLRKRTVREPKRRQ